MEDPNRGDEEENKNLPIYVEKQAAEDFSASTNPRERERERTIRLRYTAQF